MLLVLSIYLSSLPASIMQKDQIHFHGTLSQFHRQSRQPFQDLQWFMQDENVSYHDLGKVSLERAVGCFGTPQLERATRFPMPQLERATRFPNVPSRARDSFSQCSQSSLRLAFECSNSSTQFEVCVFGWFFFTIIISFCHSMPFIKFMST